MRIIFSAYFCNPYWPSESMGAFKWLTILVERYNVILFTSEASAEGVIKYYGESLPEKLKITTFKDDNFLKRRFKVQLHFGYFTFNKNISAYITKNRAEFSDVNLILHKNPTSFRYFTSLYKLEKPLVIGPLGGGLQVPKQLKDYFKSESFVNKLRILDQLVLKLPVYKRQFKKADKILITLDYLRDLLPAKVSGKTFTFFDTGIDIKNSFVERNTAADSTRTVKILWVGKLVRYKGAELLIRAAATIQNRDFHVDIVGDGIERQYLRNLVKELGLESLITLHGQVPFEHIDRFYEDSDIFCFPTLTEASGNSLLEAMKFGLPIVSVNNGGPKYMCPDEGTFKIPIMKVEEMISAIRDKLTLLIDSAQLREKMGRANYDHCKATYTWESLSKNIYALVDSYKEFQH